MAEPLRPNAAKLYTRENWYFVETIASATLAPSVIELTALSTLDFTNIGFREGAPNPEQETNLVDQNPRIGDANLFQFVGETKYNGGPVTLQFNPQGVAAGVDVKAWELLNNGAVGFMVHRMNIPKDLDPAAGQFVDVLPCEYGPFMPTRSGEGEGAEAAMVGTYAITAKPAYKIAILA